MMKGSSQLCGVDAKLVHAGALRILD
ncbi:hypothetical protein AZE42_07092 [Rhizopogon vesiculosus]|uniref:Uncharacterized protein n=1 Tax=Rhizopogon vesiculosus TaxID=180088 RepID=A0A1J8PLL6_9AGAM|nr:hypothetical protein AZE42_07092 [Rhizopogon vesiculosus]